MKAKDLIKALSALNPESDVIINIRQSNKVFGVVQLPIKYGSQNNEETKDLDDNYLSGRNQWVNEEYGGSITVHLPTGAFISRLPKKDI
jgi:hypothetical protein